MQLKSFFLTAFLFLTFGTKAQMVRYSDDVKTTQIDTLNGFYNGEIKFWNNKGNILLEGNYKDNQKFGKWIYYDSIGNQKVIREYQNSYEFQNLKGEKLSVSVKKDKNGLAEYPEVNHSDIIFNVTALKLIPKTEYNSVLFEDDYLWIKLIECIKKGADVYSDFPFTKSPTKSEIDKIINSYTHIVTGFQIKEINFIDRNTKNFERRIIGISPMFKDNPDDNIWVYYPEIKEFLSQEISDFILFGNDIFMMYWDGMEYQKYNGVYNSRQERLEKTLDYDIHLLKTEHKIITE